MRQFFISSARFIWRVTQRSIAAIILLFLDVTDLWARYVEPFLNARGIYPSPFAMWLIGTVTPWTIAAIFVGAILYTFYEVDRQVTRPPKVGKQLKRFYVESSEMLRRDVKSDADVAKLSADYQAWLQRVADWMKANMEPASLSRFLHFQMSLPFQHHHPLNDAHQIQINGISVYHRNLDAMIQSQEWR